MKILKMGDGTEFPIIPDAIADRDPVLKDGVIASYGYVTLDEAAFGSYNLDLSLDGNSIYVIRHHHNGEYKDLDEILKQNIYILGDAILKFEGGKLSNCNIICSGKLIIDALPVQIFENVDINVITNINVYPEWFGAISATKDNLTYTEVINPNFPFSTNLTSVSGEFNKWIGFSTVADLEKDGLLKKIVFNGTAKSDYTFNIRISKKTRDSNGNITGCSTVLDNLSVTLLSGKNEIDVSNLNITFRKNYVLEIYIETITATSPIYEVIKFQSGNRNYIQYREQAVAAPGFNMFTIDAVISYNEQINNTPIFNNIITQIYNMSGAHNLILTGAYLIKDTIYLRQRVNFIGSCGTDVFMSAIPENKKMGSGFIFDFNDNNKYVIDSDFALEQKDYNGESVTYDRMWFDIEGTYTDGTTDANGNPNKYPVYPSYDHGVYRKQTIIKNISIQPVKKQTPYNAPVFGGIRLIDSYFGIIESVHISGVAVGISVHKSWGYKFSNITLYACLCGFYFGKQNTAQHISDCTVESNWFGGTYTWDRTKLLWKEGDILFPPYDGKGNRPTDADFSLTDNPLVINSVGIINESDDFGKDQNKIMVDNSIFQNIDCVSLSNRGSMSFDFCYFEGALKCVLYTYQGEVKWKNPSYKGTNIHPYGVATIEGQITVEGIPDIKCYPHHTYEELKSGMLGNRVASYVIPDAHNYYDKFTITPADKATYNQGVPSNGTVGTDGIAAAKTLVSVNNTYYVGWRIGSRDFNYDYPEIASGLTGRSYTSFKNILNRFNPDIATFYTYGWGTDFSGVGAVGGTAPLLKNKKFTIIRIQDKDNSDNSATYSFPLLNTMRLFNSEIIIKNNFQFWKTARHNVDGKTPVALNYLFEVSGKCRIENEAYTEESFIAGKFIKLAAGPNNEPVELEFIALQASKETSNVIDNPNNVKFKAKIRTKLGTATLTNTVPPSVGMEIGETWVYTPSGASTVENPSAPGIDGSTNYDSPLALRWDGSVWKDINNLIGTSVGLYRPPYAAWDGDTFYYYEYINSGDNPVSYTLYTK